MPVNLNSLVMAGLMLALTHSSVARAESAPNANTMSTAEAVFYLAESAQDATEVSVIEGDILSSPRIMQRGIGVRPGDALWKDGVVPYYIDPELQPFIVVIVEKAVTTWNRVAGISLIKINPKEADSPLDYLHFTPANGCASWIGRQGGAQEIWTAPNCSAGSMMHEIGHALGLEHEHTRPDRDQYISINWDNIDADKVDNFNTSASDRKYYGAYDYVSIMHYGEYFFSTNGDPTINILVDTDVQIGQRITPSEGDIKAISMLYASDVSLVSNVINESGRSEITLLVTNESAQGANQLEIILQIGSAQMLSNNNQQWQCATYQGTLNCTADRLQGLSHASIVLLLDQELSEKELNPKLVTKTPNANMANNNRVVKLAAANAVGSSQLYSDEQLEVNAGSAGTGLLALFSLMLIVKRRVIGIKVS